MTRIQIALTTDMRMFEPTVISMMSAVESAGGPVTVHFMGWELDAGAMETIDAAVGCWPGTELVYHDLVRATKKGLSHLRFDGRHSEATKAILHVPRLVGEGKVLYLDSDTLTCADIGPLFDLDMQGCLIAAARDYGYLDIWAGTVPDADMNPYDDIDSAMSPYPVQDFINTGIVLFDCDAMLAESGVIEALENPVWLGCDMRRMVSVLKGRMLHLHPSWNALCGIYHRYPASHRAMVSNDPDYAHLPPKIVHHVGVEKPWHAFDLDELRADRGGGAGEGVAQSRAGCPRPRHRLRVPRAEGRGLRGRILQLGRDLPAYPQQICRHAERLVGAGQVPKPTSAANETPGPE